ncbi:hydrolase Nlp/P60 [Paenibacillus psychroresistens]|uniref:Hydrolase Nlp/P60 n=1 Tax=Paenibacillus psychroresistens TaxID=1778678 RepID=A0A6B8RSB8_9BACL|nr:SH3 domain-containing C40 family peptidase [Paenibacillus psychroresistens]QGQ98652.1 hydrolase Nlp/P60 [Paenibacillus psychroresistens]
MGRMLKVSLMVVLLSMLFIPVIAQAATGAITEAKIVQSVSLRNGPSTTSGFIRYLQKNESVEVLDKVNAYWYSIKDSKGKRGYVSTANTYITVKSNAKIIAGVNFRTQPSPTGARIRMLQPGEKMLVLEKVNSAWYRAQDMNGIKGYVSTSPTYLTTDLSVTGIKLPLAEEIDRVIQAGIRYLGTPYEFGSSRSDTDTFDCSDFIRQAFLDGINDLLPGDSRAQGSLVKQLDTDVTHISQLKRGDLMFFMSYEGSKASDYASINKSKETITHVGIYLGNGKILHTYSIESGGVREDKVLGNAWEYRFLYGGSVLK